MSTNQKEINRTDTILVVDDETDSLRLLTEILTREGYRVRPVERPLFALQSALADPPLLILLDVKMEEMDGFELSRQLKQKQQTKDIPIIFVSGLEDVKDRVQGFEAGGVDFISKPFQETEILVRVHSHLRLRHMQLHLEDLVAERTTDLVAANNKMREARDYLKNLTESMGDAVFLTKMPERKIEWFNDSFCLFGYDPKECIGKSTEFLYTDRTDFLSFGDTLNKFLAEDRNILHAEQIFKRKSGEIFPAEITITKFMSGKKLVSFTGIVRDITDRKQMEIRLKESFREIKKLKELHEKESLYLRDEINLEHNYKNIIGNSNALQYVLFKVEQVANTDSSVILLGETGTGKELFARAIHHYSLRSDRPLIKLNCAALPVNLIESELFGHERGSFTGAGKTHLGRFEIADNSTIFLDEIGELPLELQAKLLRVIEDGEFERLGSTKTLKVNVRIIAATNRDLAKDSREGRFRQDLWYRLNVFPISLPPLRERIDDIPILIKHFVDIFSKKIGRKIESVPANILQILQNYSWPGNVRELENIIERAVISTSGSKLRLSEELREDDQTSSSEFNSLHNMEREYILKVLVKTNWKVSGKNSAAEILKIDRSTLRSKMKKLSIQKPSN